MADKETVKALVGDTTISDAIVSFYLDHSADMIKNYCGIGAVPEQLKSTQIQIAALKVKANTSGAVGAIGSGAKVVQTIADGNQTISYANVGAMSATSDAEILLHFAPALDRFRVLAVNRQAD